MTDVAHGTSVFEHQQQEEAAKKPLLGKNGEKFGKKLGNAAIFGAVSFRCWSVCVWGGGLIVCGRARRSGGKSSTRFFESESEGGGGVFIISFVLCVCVERGGGVTIVSFVLRVWAWFCSVFVLYNLIHARLRSTDQIYRGRLTVYADHDKIVQLLPQEQSFDNSRHGPSLATGSVGSTINKYSTLRYHNRDQSKIPL